MRVNPKLTRIFIDNLRACFSKYEVKGIRLDPWWWPRGPGRSKEDWGLPMDADLEHASLLGRAARESGRRSSAYCGFLGSVRALPGCPILISIRPSAGYMQHSFSKPEEKLPLIPEQACVPGARLYPLHFTDMFKFRQQHSLDDPFENTDEDGWQRSIDCLADELDYLAAIPRQVIVVARHVERCFAPGGPLHYAGEMRKKWRDTEELSRLESALAPVEGALGLDDHRVTFWSTRGFKGQIERALQSTPAHDASLYLPALS